MLSERVANDLQIYNQFIEDWVNGLNSLRISPEECNIKTINQKKKKFYFIHYKRGTKGIKHYANMMLDHLEKEQRDFYAYEQNKNNNDNKQKKDEEQSNGNDV